VNRLTLEEQLDTAAFLGIKPSLTDCPINRIITKNVLFSLSRGRKILSTRDGFKEVTAVGENVCPETLREYAHRNPEEFRRAVMESTGKPPEECALLYTGAEIEQGVLKIAGDELMVFVTTDVRTNAMRAGIDAPFGKRAKDGPGTINIFLFTGADLSEAAMSRCLITVTEAKCAALQDEAISSSYSPRLTATGTGTDNIIVIPGSGETVNLLRGHSKLSLLIGKTVAEATRESLSKRLLYKERSPV
jgi:adenosylcobinamide amidohydrolase